MLSKQKGNIGFTATVLELQKHQFNVFSEIGDLSRIDLIAEKNNKLVKIQVKYATEKNGTIALYVKKSGPNGYRYTYSNKDVDWFAVYCSTNGYIYWVKADKACENKVTFNLRISPSKNNQKEQVNNATEFDIDGLLRDFTQSACNGDDKVQTTTKVLG